MRTIIGDFLKSRRGATAVEYSLIVAVLSLAIVSGVQLAGDSIQNVWFRIANTIDESWRF